MMNLSNSMQCGGDIGLNGPAEWRRSETFGKLRWRDDDCTLIDESAEQEEL